MAEWRGEREAQVGGKVALTPPPLPPLMTYIADNDFCQYSGGTYNGYDQYSRGTYNGCYQYSGGTCSEGCAASRASTSPARPSTLSAASSSARVGPAVTMASWAPFSTAALASLRTRRKRQQTSAANDQL